MTVKNIGGSIFIDDEHAEVIEVSGQDEQRAVRFYCSHWPDGFKLQIRTFGKRGRVGKDRFFVATASVSLEEMREMLAFAEEQARGRT